MPRTNERIYQIIASMTGFIKPLQVSPEQGTFNIGAQSIIWQEPTVWRLGKISRHFCTIIRVSVETTSSCISQEKERKFCSFRSLKGKTVLREWIVCQLKRLLLKMNELNKIVASYIMLGSETENLYQAMSNWKCRLKKLPSFESHDNVLAFYWRLTYYSGEDNPWKIWYLQDSLLRSVLVFLPSRDLNYVGENSFKIYRKYRLRMFGKMYSTKFLSCSPGALHILARVYWIGLRTCVDNPTRDRMGPQAAETKTSPRKEVRPAPKGNNKAWVAAAIVSLNHRIARNVMTYHE